MPKLVSLLSLFLTATASNAITTSTLQLFEPHQYNSPRTGHLNYRLLKPPNYHRDQQYPLLLFLHGDGEAGDDNHSQLINIGPVVADPTFRRKYPSFVLIPQIPTGTKWVYIDWKDERGGPAPGKPSKGMRHITELLQELKLKLPVDQNRIYVTGISMGGHGTWDILWRNPKLFAAAVPICGGGDPTKAPIIKDIPIWDFHGADDPVVPAQRSRAMIIALRKTGGHPRLTEYPHTGHAAWLPAYADTELFAWLFAQKKM